MCTFVVGEAYSISVNCSETSPVSCSSFSQKKRIELKDMRSISARLAMDIALDRPIRGGTVHVEGIKYVVGMPHVTSTMKAVE